jgi:hypothetical protein
MTPEALGRLADDLGLSVDSLQQLCVGWAAEHRAWTFPMRDAVGNVLGIRLRLRNGRKLAVRGGHEGLFIPTRLTEIVEANSGQLLVAEGPTDTAALLDLGFDTIGRPSCSGGTRLLVEFIRRRKVRSVVVVADSDMPGQRGAANLAEVLTAYAASIRIVTPPVPQKDARAWGSLRHRFLVAGERSRVQDDDSVEATRALREMLSAGKLCKQLPVKDPYGRMETVTIEQDGPIAFIESTTLAKVFEEDENRCIMLHTDEQPEQTRRIVTKLSAGYSNSKTEADGEKMVLRHHALQRMLEHRSIVIPYADRLGELFPCDRVQVRRAYPQLMSMIQAVTLLYQRQRLVDSQGSLIATVDDYQLARHLLATPMARLLGGRLSDPARRFYERLRGWFSIGDVFSTRDVVQRERSATDRAVRGWLLNLHDASLIDQVEPRRGSIPANWKLSSDRVDEIGRDCPGLPAIQDVFPGIDFRQSGAGQDPAG